MTTLQSHKNSFWMALLAMGLSVLFWSLGPLLLKYFTHVLDTWTVNGMRYLFAVCFWLPYLFQRRYETPPGRNIWLDVLPPTLAHIVGQVLFGIAPYFNDATIINFVTRVSFLFTTLFGFSLLRDERPLARSPWFWTGFAFTAGGLGVMYIGGRGSSSSSTAGMLILLGAAACWGLYSVLVRRFLRGYSARLSFGIISLYAAPFLLGLMFLLGDWRALFHLTLLQWFLLWLSAVAGIALGHTFFYQAIHALGPVTSEGGLLFIPFLTAALASVFLGERMSHLQWTGGLILISGSIFLLAAKMHIHGQQKDAQQDKLLIETPTD